MMSWSFSATDENPKETQRKFENFLNDPALPIPLSIFHILSDGAAAAMNTVPERCGLTLASSGHVNKDGTGNCRFEFSIGKLPEPTPPGGHVEDDDLEAQQREIADAIQGSGQGIIKFTWA